MLFVKPNGTELEVSDASAEYARSLGWKEKSAVKKSTAKKKASKKASK